MGSAHSRSSGKKGDGRVSATRKFQTYHLPFQKQKKFAKLKARLFGKKKPNADSGSHAPQRLAMGQELNKSCTASSLQELPTRSAHPFLSTAHSQQIYCSDSAADESTNIRLHCFGDVSEKSTAIVGIPLPKIAPLSVRNQLDNLSLQNERLLCRSTEYVADKGHFDNYSIVVRDKCETMAKFPIGESSLEEKSNNVAFEDSVALKESCEETIDVPIRESSSEEKSGNSIFEDSIAGSETCLANTNPPVRESSSEDKSGNSVFEDAIEGDILGIGLTDGGVKSDHPRPSDNASMVTTSKGEIDSSLNAIAKNTPSKTIPTEPSNTAEITTVDRISIRSEENKASSKKSDFGFKQGKSNPQRQKRNSRTQRNAVRRQTKSNKESDDSSEERSGSLDEDRRRSSASDVISGTSSDVSLDGKERTKVRTKGKEWAPKHPNSESIEAKQKESKIKNSMESMTRAPSDPDGGSCSDINGPVEKTDADIIKVPDFLTIGQNEPEDAVTSESQVALISESVPLPSDEQERVEQFLEFQSRVKVLQENDEELAGTEPCYLARPDLVSAVASCSALLNSEQVSAALATCDDSDKSGSSSCREKVSMSLVSSNGSGSDIDDDIWDEDGSTGGSPEAIKTKLVLDLIRNLEVDMGDFHAFTELSGSFEDKYQVLPLHEFLTTNLESKFSLDDLGRCLRVLAKYGWNLLKDESEELKHWRKVIIPPKMMMGHWLCVQGAKEILIALGYEEIDGNLVYPVDKEPVVETTAAWVVEMLLAAHEINAHCMGSHPQPDNFRDVIEAGDGDELGHDEALQPSPGIPPQGDDDVEPLVHPTEEDTSNTELKVETPDRPDQSPPLNEGDAERPLNATPGEREQREREDSGLKSDMFGRRTVVPWLMEKEKRPPVEIVQQRCHLCGSSSPAFRCEKCSNLIFCKSCDDMYHRHPKRRDHARKAVGEIPPPLPPPRPPSKSTDPNKIPVPPPRRRKSQKSNPSSPILGRKMTEQKPELPKKQFPLKFGSLKRFIPGASNNNNNGRPPLAIPPKQFPTQQHQQQQQQQQQQPKQQLQQQYEKGYGNADFETIRNMVDAKYGAARERIPPESQSNFPNRRQAHLNYTNSSPTGYYELAPNAAEQSSSDPDEEASGPRSIGRGSGSYGGSGPGEEDWLPPTGPLPPPYGGTTARSIASQNHAGFRPEHGYGISTLGRRNTVMTGTLERALGSGGHPRPSSMQHSTSVCDLSNRMMHSPYMMGYPLPQVQSMADLHQEDMIPMTAPCGCRPNWMGPDVFGQWHPPVQCMLHGSNANMYPGGLKQQHFNPGYSTEGMFGPMPHPGPYPAMAPRHSPAGYAPVHAPGSIAASDGETKPPFTGRPPSPAVSSRSTASRRKSKEAAGRVRPSRRRPRPATGTSSEEDYFSAGESDEEGEDGDSSPRERGRRVGRNRNGENGTWECEHCTFINGSDTRICNVCCKTTGRKKSEKKGENRRASNIAGGRLDSEKTTPVRPPPCKDKSRRTYRETEDDGEYEDLEDGRENCAGEEGEKPLTKDVSVPSSRDKLQRGVKMEGSTKSSERSEDGTETERNESTRKGVEVALDPMESAPLSTVDRMQSDTQTYSTVFKEKILLPTSASKINGVAGNQKNVMSKGTSPPPQSIATQTPNDVWMSDPPKSSSLCRTSSRLSLAGDSADAGGFGAHHTAHPALKRAMSLHFPRSYGTTAEAVSNWGLGHGPVARSGSRSSLMSDHHFGYNPSGPPSRDASPPPQPRNFVSRRESARERGQIIYPGYSHANLQEDRGSRINGGHNDYYLSLEELVEKRRQETLRSQGLELVRLLREAEQQNFSADDLQVALNHCGNENPVQWLNDNWKNMVDTVVTLATNYGNDKKKNDIGIMSNLEAKESLRLHKGNIWAAVTECVERRQKKFTELQMRGNFSREEVVAALTSNQGNVEAAFEDLNKAALKPFLMRIWGPPTGVENEAGANRSQMKTANNNKTASDFLPLRGMPYSSVLDDPIEILNFGNVGDENPVMKEDVDGSISDEGSYDREEISTDVTDDPHEAGAEALESLTDRFDIKEDEFFDAVPGTPSDEPCEPSSAESAPLPPSLDLVRSGSYVTLLKDISLIPSSATAEPPVLHPRFEKTFTAQVVQEIVPIELYESSVLVVPHHGTIIDEKESGTNCRRDEELSSRPTIDLPNIIPIKDEADPPPEHVDLGTKNTVLPSTKQPAKAAVAPPALPPNECIPTSTHISIFPDSSAAISSTATQEKIEVARKIYEQDGGCEKPIDEDISVDRAAVHDVGQKDVTELRFENPLLINDLTSDNTAIQMEITIKSTRTLEKSQRKVKPRPKCAKAEFERRVRQFLAEGKLPSYERAEVAVQLIDLKFGESEAICAAKECSDVCRAVSYLQQDCELCTGKFPMERMVSMLNCVHRCCRNCAKDYFTLKIKERNIMEAICPFCTEPNLNDEDVATDYFNNLDIVLKNLVDGEIHELFQRKLRDRALMNDPNFHWCQKCASGFMTEPNRKRLVCPDCKFITCAECKKPWEKQHDGISCKQFEEWKQHNDPEYQLAGLEKYMAEYGIACPKCKFKYELAKGGCMHFTCSQCKFDFCSGCGRPFRMAKKCGVSQRCERLGLHAHHPRNCLFYLRDKDPEDLMKLLDDNDIDYDIDIPFTEDENGPIKRCPVIEQKELPDGNEDAMCGREVEDDYPGLCRAHYIEYLGGLLYKNKLDPIHLLSEDDLEAVIRNTGKRLPARSSHLKSEEYRQNMIKLILREIPLEEA